jgi:phosphorylcholine metabolism protein LicD
MLDLKWYWYQNAKNVVLSELQDLRHDIYELKYNMPFDGNPITSKAHSMFKPMWHVPHSVFAKSTLVEFEGEYFSAPIGYDYYLKHRFGDYMQLPPENEQIAHNSIPFLKEGR